MGARRLRLQISYCRPGLREERLPHQHWPQRELPVLGAGKMLEPLLANGARSESGVFEAICLEELLGPRTKPAAKPAVERDGKAHLFAVAELRREVFGQH